ncbi:uncharacterized protein LOC127878267 [Dreissena polymorpha]|uniref:uncharacterized protein LOC127878267 n=1 Tax=Dreissena polymorpha TaxID=45954 RepID=UPI0022641C48|nr:uncharacterized protein LOC127878267 [Dreissena polymorpha]
MEYSSAAWSTTAKTNQQALDKVQNQALRIITGATKSTPIAFMEKLTGIQPLHERRQTKVLLQAEKFKSLPDHPIKARLTEGTKNRLKRGSFVHQVKTLNRQFAQQLDTQTTPLSSEDIVNPTANDLSKTDQLLEPLKTEELGSSSDIHQAEMKHFSWPQERGAAITKLRLMKAASMIENSPEDTTSVVFLTDARSVLEALTNNTSPKLAKLMTRLSNNLNIALQWIPAHCGVSGNEEADQLAKQGANTEQPNTQVTYREKVSIIKAITRPQQEQDAYHLLNRAEQVVMVRLRSGHNRLNAHLYRKCKLVPSPLCPCGEEEQTAEHVLQRCKRHDQERAADWSEDTTLNRKLYGGLEDLRRTATFIAETGMIV